MAKPFAAEEEARRLYDGMRWPWGSRTGRVLANKGMQIFTKQRESLPRLRLSEAVPCLKEISVSRLSRIET